LYKYVTGMRGYSPPFANSAALAHFAERGSTDLDQVAAYLCATAMPAIESFKNTPDDHSTRENERTPQSVLGTIFPGRGTLE
jgi:hypothetical protein